jgi:hypothetical protein
MDIKELEMAKKADQLVFLKKSMEKTEPCFFCGSKDTWDVAIMDGEFKMILFARPIDGQTRAVCKKHHYIMVKLDNIVTQIYKLIFRR